MNTQNAESLPLQDYKELQQVQVRRNGEWENSTVRGEYTLFWGVAVSIEISEGEWIPYFVQDPKNIRPKQ